MFTRLKQILKRNNFLYSVKYCHESKEYIENKKLMEKSTIKSKDQIKEEISDLYSYWKCRPEHYIRYGLFMKNLSKEQLRDYIPPYVFYVQYLSEQYQNFPINEMDDKLNLYNLFTARGISTPKVLAVGGRNYLHTPEGNDISWKTLVNENLVDSDDKLFIKPTKGSGGNGILVLQRTQQFLTLNKVNISLTELQQYLPTKGVYVVQRGLKQREDISRINPYSVNTLRLITRNDDAFSIPICIMRIGRNSSDVDNSAQGGLSIVVNPENGELSNVASAEHGGGIFEMHPDTGFCFSGYKIEGWSFIREKLQIYTQKLNDFPIFAWDVAILPNGPCIIEINFNFGIDHIQCCAGGMRQKLGIFPKK